MDLFDLLAVEIFIADGGVDDYEEMTDDDLREIITDYLRTCANDRSYLDLVVSSARTIGKEMS